MRPLTTLTSISLCTDMRPHSDRLRRTVYCVGAARLIRDVAPLLENATRVRWAADVNALARVVHRDPDEPAGAGEPIVACIVEDADLDRLTATLALIRQTLPTARRLAVVETCDVAVVRRVIETSLADALLYRPLEMAEVRKAAGLSIVSGEAMSPHSIRPRSASPLA